MYSPHPFTNVFLKTVVVSRITQNMSLRQILNLYVSPNSLKIGWGNIVLCRFKEFGQMCEWRNFCLDYGRTWGQLCSGIYEIGTINADPNLLA